VNANAGLPASVHAAAHITTSEAAGVESGDPARRNFAYFVLTGSRFIAASALRFAVVKFVSTLSASADVMALSKIEVDLADITEGNMACVVFRGKPLFIRHRTGEVKYFIIY
jgi:ubiquinol-cytochrome c reductase iron-sulfur subunit